MAELRPSIRLMSAQRSLPARLAPRDSSPRPSSETKPPPTDESVQPLDMMVNLKRSEASVVKTRAGSVLSRGFILKTDYYPSGQHPSNPIIRALTRSVNAGRALDIDLNVHGAPNFRAPRQGNLNVFGVAQPRTQGLRAILSVLRCRPGTSDPAHVVWFSTREEPIGKSTTGTDAEPAKSPS